MGSIDTKKVSSLNVQYNTNQPKSEVVIALDRKGYLLKKDRKMNPANDVSNEFIIIVTMIAASMLAIAAITMYLTKDEEGK